MAIRATTPTRRFSEAGCDPEVTKTYGWGAAGNTLNPTRKQIRDLTGQNWVPVLVTDDGEVIQGSTKIVEWAQAQPPADGVGPPRDRAIRARRRRPSWRRA